MGTRELHVCGRAREHMGGHTCVHTCRGVVEDCESQFATAGIRKARSWIQPRGCVELIGCGGELGHRFTAAIPPSERHGVLYRVSRVWSFRHRRFSLENRFTRKNEKRQTNSNFMLKTIEYKMCAHRNELFNRTEIKSRFYSLEFLILFSEFFEN